MNVSLLHPIVNHFTIALIIVGILLDIFGKITKKQYLHTVAWINLIIGTFAGILTIITGLIAANNVQHSEAAHQIMEKHETLGFVIIGVLFVILIWRIILKGRFPLKGSILYLFFGVILLTFILINGYLGGELVFKHGVAVEKYNVGIENSEHHHHNHNQYKENESVEDSTKDTVFTPQSEGISVEENHHDHKH